MMAGVSAGASVKSKKLQQRNAILRSTGFIEEAAHVKGVGGTSPRLLLLDPLAMSLSYLVVTCNMPIVTADVRVTALTCVILHW